MKVWFKKNFLVGGRQLFKALQDGAARRPNYARRTDGTLILSFGPGPTLGVLRRAPAPLIVHLRSHIFMRPAGAGALSTSARHLEASLKRIGKRERARQQQLWDDLNDQSPTFAWPLLLKCQDDAAAAGGSCRGPPRV